MPPNCKANLNDILKQLNDLESMWPVERMRNLDLTLERKYSLNI